MAHRERSVAETSLENKRSDLHQGIGEDLALFVTLNRNVHDL